MPHAVVRVLDGLECAEQARLALLADGFGADVLELSINSDEAGPVAGNFVIGNSPPESPYHTYERNYAPSAGPGPVERDHCVLTVAAPDAALAARAAAILARFGARDPDCRLARCSG